MFACSYGLNSGFKGVVFSSTTRANVVPLVSFLLMLKA